MRHTIRWLLLASALLLLAAPAFADPPAGFPADLRWDLVPKWISWNGSKDEVRWPPSDGCAETAIRTTLVPGTMVDRFGSEAGSYVSPQGASFRARALPYVCSQMGYRIYRVDKPLSVLGCQVAAWFDEPGGAMQMKLGAPVAALVATGALVTTTVVQAGGTDPPQCSAP